jgi:hypothetical protein
MSRILQRRASLITGSVLILLLSLWLSQKDLWLLVQGDQQSDSALSESLEKGPDASEEGRSRSTRKISEVIVNKTHKIDDLANFYHPAIVLEDASLEEGLEQLLASYRLICEETGETVLPLRWEVNGSPEMIRKLELRGRFLSSCRMLGLSARMVCEVRDGALVFSSVESGQSRTQEWIVPPTFIDYLAGLAARQKETENADPFTNKSAGVSPEPAPDLSEILEQMGVLAAGESVEMYQSSSRVKLDASEGTIALVGSLVKMSMEEIPVQILYELSHQVAGEIQLLPKIISRPGQDATIEIGREYSGMQGGEIVNAFAGVKVSLGGELYGFGERTSVFYERTDSPSSEKIVAYQESGNLEDLDLRGVGMMVPGLTKTLQNRRDNLPLSVWGDADPSGEKVYLTSRRIDVTGRTIEGP